MTHIPIAAARSRSTTFCPAASMSRSTNMPSIIAHVRAGAVRAARGDDQRTRALGARYSDHRGIGVPGFDVSSWFGFFLPAKTPKEIIAKLNAGHQRRLATLR